MTTSMGLLYNNWILTERMACETLCKKESLGKYTRKTETKQGTLATDTYSYSEYLNEPTS
jgi:hypothetical protein